MTIAATGTGKQTALLELARLATIHADLTTVIATPRIKLVKQIAKEAEALMPGQVGCYYSGAKVADKPVIVTCYPSMGALAKALPRPVGLLICDEAHRVYGSTIIEGSATLGARWRCGYSATAYLSDEDKRLEVWSPEPAYKYTAAQAIADGVLVPPRWIDLGTRDAPGPNRVYVEDIGTDETDAVVLAMIQGFGAGPGIVSASKIADAEGYAEFLRARGIEAAAVHSGQREALNDAAIDGLVSGRLRCVVDVDMLTEGVDLPQLRWLGFRHRLGSRRDFVQRLGRGLRSAPGKTECIAMDPHGLHYRFAIDQPAALGPALDDEIETMTPRQILNATRREAAEIPAAVVVDEVTRWLYDLSCALDLGERAVPWGDWMTLGASDGQVKMLGRLRYFVRFLPENLRAGVYAMIDAPWSMRRGAASDLVEVLRAMEERTRGQRDSARRAGTHARRIIGWPAGLVVEPLATAAQMRLGMGA